MSDRKGTWQQTYTGGIFYIQDPRIEEIHLDDIAHSLALQCRFAGHCSMPYSVAEHSVRVAREIERRTGVGKPSGIGSWEVVLAGLLHDASEAYLVDIPRPYKHLLDGYYDLEFKIQSLIDKKFGVGVDDRMNTVVKLADDILLSTEARDLMARPPKPWEHLPAPLPGRIQPWSWQHAEALFKSEFKRITDQIATREALHAR